MSQINISFHESLVLSHFLSFPVAFLTRSTPPLPLSISVLPPPHSPIKSSHKCFPLTHFLKPISSPRLTFWSPTSSYPLRKHSSQLSWNDEISYTTLHFYNLFGSVSGLVGVLTVRILEERVRKGEEESRFLAIPSFLFNYFQSIHPSLSVRYHYSLLLSSWASASPFPVYFRFLSFLSLLSFPILPSANDYDKRVPRRKICEGRTCLVHVAQIYLCLAPNYTRKENGHLTPLQEFSQMEDKSFKSGSKLCLGRKKNKSIQCP